MARQTTWPIPWRLVDEDHEDAEWCEVLDATDQPVPFISDIYYADDARDDHPEVIAIRAMLAAVNHYPALLAAARAVMEVWDHKDTRVERWHRAQMDEAIDALRAAVEAADQGPADTTYHPVQPHE